MTPASGTGQPAWTNPLRDPEDRRLPRIAGPCGMVLFGVTGDLSRKKVMPAIYDLANRGLLPPGFSLVGFARRDWANQDFAKIVHDSVRQHARGDGFACHGSHRYKCSCSFAVGGHRWRAK